MKILFQTKANKIELIDKERLIFNIDGKFVNEFGEEIQVEDKIYKREELDDYDCTIVKRVDTFFKEK